MLSLAQHLYVAPAIASLNMAPISPVACAAYESSYWSYVVYIFLMIWRGFLVGLGLAVVWGWNIYKRRKDRVKKASVVEPWSRVCNALEFQGTIEALPFIGDLIKDIVSSFVADQLEWPRRVVIPIGDTPADIRRWCFPLWRLVKGKLRVTVVGANGLLDENAICGNTKRYAQLFVRKAPQQKTEVSDGKTNPQWGEEFEFDVENQEAQTLVLKSDIEYGYTRTLNRTSGTADDKLGQITFKLMYHLYDADEQANAMAAESEAFRAAREANGG